MSRKRSTSTSTIRSSKRQPKTLGATLVVIFTTLLGWLFHEFRQDRAARDHPARTPSEARAARDAREPEPPPEEEVAAAKPAPTRRPKLHLKVSRGVAYAGLPRKVPPPCKSIERLESTGFTVGYCEELKDPAWVVYKAAKSRNNSSEERPQHFETDPRTKALVEHNDYKGSGYDRGHMAPNHAIATRYGREAQLETFVMSNIIPQKPDLNRKVWRLIEESIADDWANRFGEVWVVVGPVFGKTIERLPAGVAIPEACFMVITDEDEDGAPRCLAYLVPQDVRGNEDPSEFLTSVDQVERRTGLDFMSELPDDIEGEVESTKARRGW